MPLLTKWNCTLGQEAWRNIDEKEANGVHPEFEFIPSSLGECETLIQAYLPTLGSPMDSYMEDNLDLCTAVAIVLDGEQVGFAMMQQQRLFFFYLRPHWQRYAEELFDRVVREFSIEKVYFQTSDQLLTSLTLDWEIEKRRAAFFFRDAIRQERPAVDFPDLTFRLAEITDIPLIQAETGDFYDQLEQDIPAGEIYLLFSNDTLLGSGLIIPGRYFSHYASIGMITCERFRRLGVGQLILWYLKETCYAHGWTPLAGCGYWNTLSRKTLESAGLISYGRGIDATLLRKVEAKR